MKHTECKDCELSNGDCGNHFKMNGTINFEIASLSACDKYGNCMFFKSKASTSGDLISRAALKKAFREWTGDSDTLVYAHTIYSLIDNAPTVEYTFEEAFQKTICENRLYCPARPQGEWITYKTPNDEIWQIECNSCHYTKGSKWVVFNALPPYCEKCGADMRGKNRG